MSAERAAILRSFMEAMFNGETERAAELLEQGVGELPTERQRLRDEYAGQAMQAHIAAGSDIEVHGHLIAKRAWFMADAMLAERAK